MPTHAEIRRLKYPPEKMFDLVADVEQYPEFLPWCIATRIREKSDRLLVADMVIGFKVFREKFTSRVQLDRPAMRIGVAYTDGPFKYLKNHWVFNPAADGAECDVDFFVDFEFRSKLLQSAISVVFNEAVTKMVNAFEKRAEDLYGI
ncbi:MAG: type II toxin-antitoxin system RatA family toxin [Rhodospirillaceae bacterium]